MRQLLVLALFAASCDLVLNQDQGFCGDGVVQASRPGAGRLEECDDGPDNSDAPNANCRSTCELRRCGDGILDDLSGEQCDQGNANGGGGVPCDIFCQTRAVNSG